jgi:hypothetical protein
MLNLAEAPRGPDSWFKEFRFRGAFIQDCYQEKVIGKHSLASLLSEFSQKDVRISAKELF